MLFAAFFKNVSGISTWLALSLLNTAQKEFLKKNNIK